MGDRSAFEWVIDQYRVKTDNRSVIVKAPNRAEDPQYILRLIGKVISVSLETVEIVAGLPELGESERTRFRSKTNCSQALDKLAFNRIVVLCRGERIRRQRRSIERQPSSSGQKDNL